MCKDFIKTEIMPHLDRMDSMEEGFMPALMEKAGELGLLSISIPEELGGMGMDFKTRKLLFLCSLWSSHGTWNFTRIILWNRRTKSKIYPKISFWRMESFLLFDRTKCRE